jgi:hypothetical protein
MSLFHTNSILVAANGWPESSPELHAPDFFSCPTVTIPFIFVFYLFYNVAYTPLLVAYTLEILPFAIRAKGFALMVRHVMARRSPAVRSLLTIPKEFDRIVITGTQPVCGSLGPRCDRLEICRC